MPTPNNQPCPVRLPVRKVCVVLARNQSQPSGTLHRPFCMMRAPLGKLALLSAAALHSAVCVCYTRQADDGSYRPRDPAARGGGEKRNPVVNETSKFGVTKNGVDARRPSWFQRPSAIRHPFSAVAIFINLATHLRWPHYPSPFTTGEGENRPRVHLTLIGLLALGVLWSTQRFALSRALSNETQTTQQQR